MNAPPTIAIVIPTLNEEKNLPKCLASIASQDYPKDLLEIIVVDNGSTDRTVEIARAAGATILRNEIMDAEVSKMRGLRAARAECFMYLDADIELAAGNVLSQLAEPLREDTALAGAFPRFAARRDAPAMERYLHYHPLELDPVLEFFCASIESVIVERGAKWSVCDFSRRRVPPVGICLYRREILLKALEGRERFMDIDVPILAAKAGHPRFTYVENARIYHSNIRSLAGLVRKRLRNLHGVFLPSQGSREFRYLPRGIGGILKAKLLLLLANTPFYFVIRGIAKSIRYRDAACLYEPLAALALADALLIGMLKDAAGRRFIRGLLGQGQSPSTSWPPGASALRNGDSPPRDAIVINRGHLGPEEMSGGEAVAMSLCAHWARAGRRVRQICTAHTPAIWSGFRGGNIEFITCGDTGSRALAAYLRRICSLEFHLQSEPAIIYSASDFLYDVLPAHALKRRHPRAKWYAGLYLIVKMPRVKELLRSPRAAFRRMMTFLGQRISIALMRSADAVFALNEADAAEMRARLKGRVKVRVFPCGVDAAEIAGIQPGAESYDAVYLGAIHPRKGVEDLLRAWAIVTRKLPEAKLALAGTGEAKYVERMKALAESLHLENNAFFVGPHKSPAKYAFLKAARLMAHPSREESFAFSILEGMACGLPVAAYDVPAYREAYPAGIARVETGDVEKLAEEIIALLADEPRRARLSREALDLAARRDRDALTAEFLRKNDFE